jgi:hypothetical protein
MALTFSKKQLVTISLILAMLFHFTYYFNLYGPPVSLFKGFRIYFLALGSALIMIFIYIGTYWRHGLKKNKAIILYELLILWIIVSIVRSTLEFNSLSQFRVFLLNTYLGLSMLPVFFFIVGVNINYFFSINRLLTIYFIVVTIITLFFIGYFEIQLFLLYPIFYLILTIPLRNNWGKILILLATVSIIIVSFTNRAGILRIIIGYCILGVYYVMYNVKINKRLLKFLVFCLLTIPFISLYLGIQGVSVFQALLGSDTIDYSQMNPYADTRTFLYYEVFQDLMANNAIVFGKGIGSGYMSEAFETYDRPTVEVGFLQILLKTGIIGVLLYLSVIVSAISKALGKSRSIFMKSLGLLLASYVLLIFIENVVAYNLLNVIIWIVVGICHSPALRDLSDDEFKNLYKFGNLPEVNRKYVKK